MKAIQIREHGGPERLEPADLPVPEPSPGKIRVKLEAVGVNFIDVYHRTGLYKVPVPFTPGMEGAGTVDAVGEGVARVRPGDRVAYAMNLGAYAEYALVAEDHAQPIPADVESTTAAAIVLQGMTAHYLTHSTYRLEPGNTAVVHAAAGGAGALIIQMAKKLGARVIGTVSNEAKAEVARAAGADHIILYTQVPFEEEVRRITEGKGVEVVYDSVGSATFEQSLRCLRPRGMMVLFGQSSGPVPPMDPALLNARGSIYLTRPSLAHYAADRDEIAWRAGDLFRWLREGLLSVRIDRTLPLDQAADAHRALEARETSGKVLLLP